MVLHMGQENMFSVILVSPQMGENIGAAARAMYNFGLTDLRLVTPRDGWPNEKAVTMSAGAIESMPPVRVFENLPDAIADLHFVLGTTARPRYMVKPAFTPQQAVEESLKRGKSGQNIGILFGAERTGLLNDEITACHGIVTIPTNPAFSSLNLGQSVLLLAYEWMRQAPQVTPPPSAPQDNESTPAAYKDLEIFLARLERELEDTRFFRTEELVPIMKRNIRNIFTRADVTDQELRTLHGIISALRGNRIQ